MTVPRYTVGALSIAIVSDGTMWRDGGAVFGAVPKVMWSRVCPEINDRNEVPLGLNCLLVESEGKTVLIDTGYGNKNRALLEKRGVPVEHGRLLASLEAAGVSVEDVDVVINSHLHSDHCGWNTRREGEDLRPTFPNARYYVQRAEWEAALHPNERTRAGYDEDDLLPLAEAGQVEFIDGEYQVTREIRVIEAPGHTADHAAVTISSGGETAVYLGDLVHHAVQLERLPWLCAYDDLPLMSMETKRRIVAEAVARNQLLISAHNTFPGAGRLRARDGKTQYLVEAEACSPQ